MPAGGLGLPDDEVSEDDVVVDPLDVSVEPDELEAPLSAELVPEDDDDVSEPDDEGTVDFDEPRLSVL